MPLANDMTSPNKAKFFQHNHHGSNDVLLHSMQTITNSNV
jgi:hypothetical protein